MTGPFGSAKDRFWVRTTLMDLEMANPLPIFDILEVKLPDGRKVIFEEIDDPGPALQEISWADWGLIIIPDEASVLLLKIATGTDLDKKKDLAVNILTYQSWILNKFSDLLAAAKIAGTPRL